MPHILAKRRMYSKQLQTRLFSRSSTLNIVSTFLSRAVVCWTAGSSAVLCPCCAHSKRPLMTSEAVKTVGKSRC